eukprot:691868-Heterocapsa_arctica.AAC.1
MDSLMRMRDPCVSPLGTATQPGASATATAAAPATAAQGGIEQIGAEDMDTERAESQAGEEREIKIPWSPEQPTRAEVEDR